MGNQYWVLPISGMEWGQRVSGVPVSQLPDTSDMVELLVNATAARTCPDPAPGEEQWCYIEDASVEVYVMPSGGSAESYIDTAFIADLGVADGAAFNGARTIIDINFEWMGFPYRSPVIVPPAGRLYVAFESPATAGELRAVSAGPMGDWALRLDVDTHNPENLSAPINFRIFMARDGGGPQSEFWTAFVKSMEIV